MTRQGVPVDMLDRLYAPTPRDEIRQRQGPGGRMLDYVDARFVMDRLDELGPENWQDRFEDRSDGSVRCGIGVLVDGEWVWKWDVGDPSDIEPEKGAHSGAFKRAGVKWGIARDLYGHKNGSSNGRGVTGTTERAARPSSPPAAGSANGDDFWERGEEAKPEFAPIGNAGDWAGKRAGDPCPECGEPLKGRDEDVYHPTGLDQPKYHRPPKARGR